jgi:hypothetical protein
MRAIAKKFMLVAGCAALVASPTAAAAAAPTVQGAAPTSWMMLSMLSPASAVALEGANGAAQAQPDVPPPAPPPMAQSEPANAGVPTPPLPVIAIWLAEIGLVVWIATRHDNHVHIPNSPA